MPSRPHVWRRGWHRPHQREHAPVPHLLEPAVSAYFPRVRALILPHLLGRVSVSKPHTPHPAPPHPPPHRSKSRKKCPTCRAPCHVSAFTAHENIALAAIAQTCFPETYALRLPEVQAARSAMEMELPVFYYNCTQFPGAPLQLDPCAASHQVRMMVQGTCWGCICSSHDIG